MSENAHWIRLSALFDRAIDMDASARTQLLDTECEGDPALRAALQKMLDADAATSGIDMGARALADLSKLAIHEDDDDPLEDCHLGPWRLQELLGRGGMGSVHVAVREDDNDHRAAVKRLHRRWDGSAQAERFLQERRILASLSHRNLPRLIDHGVDGSGRPWFALEYVDGDTLIAWADAHRLNLRARLDLFRQVCAAVQHAHEHFVVHRDLKPANILVDNQGHPKVLDFGVAKRMDDIAGNTRTGAFAGFTPEYAAPEQIYGGVISAATDVYALGVILYQLLTGQLPYHVEHDNLRDAAEAITTRTAARMDKALVTGEPEEVAERVAHRNTSVNGFRRFVRGDLTRIVQTALAKEPQRRYASVIGFSDDLKRLLEGRPVSVGGDTFAYRARKFVQRNRWGVAMAALAGFALLAGVTGISVKTREVQKQAASAERSAAHATAEGLRAQSEATRATASRDFLASLLAEASPEKNGGHDTTVSEVLDRARVRIDTELTAQPDLRVEMMTLIASTYDDLSRYDDGKALLVKAVSIANANPSIPISVRANAHAEYAFSLLSASKAVQAEIEAETAVALLRQQPAAGGLVSALGTLATAQYLQEKFPLALNAQREAARLTALIHGKHSDDYAEALLELSYFLDGAKRSDEAVVEAGKAVALLEHNYPDGRDPAVSRALWAWGSALCSAGRASEAVAPLERALVQVRAIYGAETLKYMRSLQLLGRAELGVGRIEEATTHLQQAAALVHAQSPDHPIATLIQISLGEAQLRAGVPIPAIGTLRDALTRLAGNSTNATSRTDAATVLLAKAYDAAGRHQDAKRILTPRIVDMRRRQAPQLLAALVAAAANARSQRMAAASSTALAEAARLADSHSLPAVRADLSLEQSRTAGDAGDLRARREFAKIAKKILIENGMSEAPEFAAATVLAE